MSGETDNNTGDDKAAAGSVVGGAGADAAAAGEKVADKTVATAGADKTKVAEGDKTKEAAKPPPIEWDKWSPKDAEGTKRDEKGLADFRSLAKKHGLTGEAAQALVEHYDGMSRAADALYLEKLEETQKTWSESIKADKEYGGAKLKETHADVERAMKKFGEDPELRKFLNDTGFGNHPGLIKFVARIGKAMREDAVNGGAETKTSKQTLLDQLYGNSASKA